MTRDDENPSDTNPEDTKMLKVTFQVFEPCLNNTFINVKEVKSMDDFRLYAYSLWSGNWSIISVE